jgi:SH3-like domain-containing protein
MAIGIPSFLACSWDWTPVGQAWEYVQTAPSTGSNLPLYLEPGNTEQIVTELESGVPAQVLESSSALVNGRVEMWTKLRSEDGREGWARGKSFMPIVTERISGSRAVPAEVESYDTAAGKMALIPVQMYRQPDESSDSPGLLPFRAEVVILRCQDQWCLIRTADSQMGWVQEWKLVGLPWAPVEL